MDGFTRQVAEVVPVWEPQSKNGHIEVSINYIHETTGRMTFDSVNLPRYIEFWDKGLLKHQQQGKPKPEHLPTREEALRTLEQENTELAQKPEPQSFKPAPVTSAVPVAQKENPQKKPTLTAAEVEARLKKLRETGQKKITKPKAQILTESEENIKDEPGYKPNPKPVQTLVKRQLTTPSEVKLEENLGWDIDACAKQCTAFTEREWDVIDSLLDGKKVDGLTQTSFCAKLSGMCSKIGLPHTNRYIKFDRLGALKRTVLRYRELVNTGHITSYTKTRAAHTKPTFADERELIFLFRRRPPADRERILEYARSLKADG